MSDRSGRPKLERTHKSQKSRPIHIDQPALFVTQEEELRSKFRMSHAMHYLGRVDSG